MTGERMPLVGPSQYDRTPDEPWRLPHNGPGWYAAAAAFACQYLSSGGGRRCLVLGSPLAEADGLANLGWQVTYLDIRTPPRAIRGETVQADAAALPFQDGTFAAVSSTCMLCHAGLGRYGDPIRPNGDLAVLREVARVLEPGGLAAVMAGPALPSLKQSVLLGREHRVYSPEQFVAEVATVGLSCRESALWSPGRWLTPEEIATRRRGDKGREYLHYCYLQVLLEMVLE